MIIVKKIINFVLDLLALPWLVILILDHRAKLMLLKWKKKI